MKPIGGSLNLLNTPVATRSPRRYCLGSVREWSTMEVRMLHFLWEALIGLLVGAVAKLLMPGKDPGGILVTMAIGILGSLLASYLGQAVGWYQAGQSAGIIMSIVGAMALLAIYHLFRRTRSA